MVTDPIADMLVRITNAGRRRAPLTAIPYSRLKETIVEMLVRDGFLSGVVHRGRKTSRRLEVALQYREDGTPFIRGCRRVSRPGRRTYASAATLQPPRYGKGVTIVSTPLGVFSHREAKAKHVGGEVLVEVWQ